MSEVESAGEIHHVTIGVRDLNQSLHFYVEGLGLKETLKTQVGGRTFERLLRLPVGSTARTIFLQGPSRVGQVELVQWDPPVDIEQRPRRAGEIGFSVVSFALSSGSFPIVVEQLRQIGVEFWNDPERTVLNGYGEIELCIVEDPDGNMIELVRLPSDEEVRALRAAETK